MPPRESTFLDVKELLERSWPSHRKGWFWFVAGAFLLVVMISAYITQRWPWSGGLVETASLVALVALMGMMSAITLYAVRRQRREQQQLAAMAELVQLRRWPQAACMAAALLSHPTRTMAIRLQGLIFLSSILARYNRFADAIAVHTHLLETIHLDSDTEYAIRLGRTMAMLREDQLVDADRSIGELRRKSGGRDADGNGGLALVEMYRDVKTGHPAEAVEIFQKHLPIMRKQLGHRAGDAWALAARAYDMLGDSLNAQKCWENATTLAPAIEFARRYPEIAEMSGRLSAAAAPPEAV